MPAQRTHALYWHYMPRTTWRRSKTPILTAPHNPNLSSEQYFPSPQGERARGLHQASHSSSSPSSPNHQIRPRRPRSWSLPCLRHELRRHRLWKHRELHDEFGEKDARKTPNNLGLVAYYPFDEGTSIIAHDFSGNHNIGTLTTTGSTLPQWVSGKKLGALSFDGSTSYVDVPLAVNYSAFTISLWFKATSLLGNKRIAANSHTDADNKGFEFYIGDPNGFATFVVGNGTAFGQASYSSSAFSTGTWYHFVGTYDGANVRSSYQRRPREHRFLPHWFHCGIRERYKYRRGFGSSWGCFFQRLDRRRPHLQSRLRPNRSRLPL